MAAPRPRSAAKPPARPLRRAVHGVLLLDKALGVSSNAALQRAKRLYRAEKADMGSPGSSSSRPTDKRYPAIGAS